MSMIIAVDYDGTLSYGEYPACGKPNIRLIEWLNERKENGDKIILWTCRRDKHLDDAVRWCRDWGLEFDAANENLPEMIEKWGGDTRKIACDYYIDDQHFTSDFLIKKNEKKLSDKKRARII